MTSVKAKLCVVLKADDVVVAEVDDPRLWQRVLVAINTGDSLLEAAPLTIPAIPATGQPISQPQFVSVNGSTPIEKLAGELGLDASTVEGALSPTMDAPFLHLNSHNWEAMRKQLPSRGFAALSPIAAASTVLGLWFRAAGLGIPSQAQALAVLKAIGQDDKNPTRGVRGSTWLIARQGGQVQLNASEISSAISLGRSFCLKSWAEWNKGKSE